MAFTTYENFLSMLSEGLIDGQEIKKAYVGIRNFPPRALPEGYTQIECIQSTGTQYIDTGVTVPFTADATLQGVKDTGASSVVFTIGGNTNAGGWFGFASEAWILGGATFFSNVYSEKIAVHIDWSNSTVSAVIADVEKSSDCSVSGTLLVGSPMSNFPASCKIFDLEIYNSNGTLVRDYVPCINPNGDVGLYDEANGEFYGNAGSGTFIAGTSEPSSARKLKKGYVSTNGVAQLFFNPFSIEDMAITYTGNYTDQVVTMGDGNQYRLLTLTSTGKLTLEREVTADVWVCNGGANGSTGANMAYAGAGGAGGNFCNVSATMPITSTITIASAGGSSNISGITLSNWISGAGGGGGASSVGVGSGGAKAGSSTQPFNDSYFTKYPCAGGGGGSHLLSDLSAMKQGGIGGSHNKAGSSGTAYTGYDTVVATYGASGGTTGGGRGASYKNAAGTGTYYGSGGGGANNYVKNTTAASGYQGVCFIRIPLEQSA